MPTRPVHPRLDYRMSSEITTRHSTGARSTVVAVPVTPPSVERESPPADVPSLGYRLTFVALGLCIPSLFVYFRLVDPGAQVDFDQHWLASQAVLAGDNPYEMLGPGEKYHFPFPYYYPLTSAILVAPLAALPLLWARVVFTLGSVAILAWVASRYRDRWLPMFVSGGLIHSVALGQWTPLLVAAFIAPGLGFVAAAKPHLGLVMAFGSASKRFALSGIIGGVAMAAVGFWFVPDWPWRWVEMVRSSPGGSFTAPVASAGGFILLLALLRWRHPGARLLLAMSVLPQTGLLYDTLPLFLICRQRFESWILAGLSIVALVIQTRLGSTILGGSNDPIAEFLTFRDAMGEVNLWLLYVPALAIVLFGRREEAGTNRDSRGVTSVPRDAAPAASR